MSTENWESPTWDWIEREIVDHILIADKKPGQAQSFFNWLAKPSEATSPSQKSAATQRRSTSNG